MNRLRKHLAVIDRDVAAVTERYREHMQCRKGCSSCCHQTFGIAEVEAAWLREGLLSAPPEVRQSIEAKAQGYQPNARNPCPVLDESGACRLYEHRPRICRKYGIPLWHPDRPHEVNTCELNFVGATDVDAELIIEPQAEWARDWIRLRAEQNLGPQRKRSIAAALLGDVEP